MIASVAGMPAGCGSSASDGTRPHSTTSTSSRNAATATPATPAVPKTVAGTQLAGDVAFLGPIRTVPVGKQPIAFRQFGSGSDLLLIAGQASPMSLWPATTLRHLAQGHRVTIYDNRDLGASSGPHTAFPLAGLADDAAGLIDALGLRRPSV